MPDDDRAHPDTIVGPENVALVAMFGDIDWTNRDAVERRVDELRALGPAPS